MAAFSLPDLIHQCRLARWEEEYSIMDTLELPPGQRISYPLLLCAGQEVEFKICASQTVAASIGFEQRETDRDPPEPFIHNPEASCFVIDHELKRTANYLLAVENTSDAGISLTVEISAAKRLASWRTRFERLRPVCSSVLPIQRPVPRGQRRFTGPLVRKRGSALARSEAGRFLSSLI